MSESIIKSGLVNSGTILGEEITPAAGELVIKKFVGNDSTSAKAACRLVWDYQGAGEEDIWDINQGNPLPVELSRTADGVKKLAIILENNCTANYYMSAFCEYEVI